MVPGKEIEDHFWGVEVGEKYDIQGTVDYIIYNLWVMKEPNFAARMMAADERLLADDTCKETVII